MEGTTRETSFSRLNDGNGSRFFDVHCWFTLRVEVMVNLARETAFSRLNDRRSNDDDGRRFANYDGLRGRFIPLGNETSRPTSDMSQSGPAAVVLHINDGSPGNGLHRSAHLSTSNGLRAGVHNSYRSAEDGGCVENQGGEEESRG